MLTMLDLFSGIGGFTLAASWTGQIETVCFVEIDPFCQKVLRKNFPGVPIHDDIKTFTYATLKQDDKRESKDVGDTTERRESINPASIFGNKSGIDILVGGFPCQPFSVAGKRKGTDDNRFLWPEMLRVIREVKPTWVIAENVSGLLTIGDGMVFEDCCLDLEKEGYEVQPFVVPACSVGAPHRRDRVWICAHSTNGEHGAGRGQDGKEDGLQGINRPSLCAGGFERTNCHAPDTKAERLQESRFEREQHTATEGFGIKHDDREIVSDPPFIGLQGGTQADGSKGTQPTDKFMYGRNREWHEPWIEVATRLCGIFNGVSNFLDEAGGLDGKKSIAVAGQDLPCLWQGFQQESFQWDIGGLDSVQFKANVFTVLWELFRRSYRQDFLPFESAEVQEAYLRNVWIGSEPGCPPQGWGYNEQYTREHSDSLSRLSYEVALATKEVISGYNKNRINRLKALGNAIVPQVAYEIFKAIVEIERGYLLPRLCRRP